MTSHTLDNHGATPGSPYEDQVLSASHQQNHASNASFQDKKQKLQENLARYDAEIVKYEREVMMIQVLIKHRKEERDKVLTEIEDLKMYQVGRSREKGRGGIDYSKSEPFGWTHSLRAKMKAIFNIDEFRLCQEGVCNANMDDRSIVCVMPTGGGKSLTYQLPALLQSGCTLVISPLISLITDQVLHLRECGVQAVKLTGGTSKEETTEITRRLLALARHSEVQSKEEIKLCFVTPEKIAKSKSFVNLLQQLAQARRLARIVIDEAHCVSQLGHDFRPDYQGLHILRRLFPHVPIMALSATCPPKVLEDLLKTLGLKPVVDGNNADTQGTTYFTAPLYRKNLHYAIVPKPAKGDQVIQAMASYILEHHADHSGIVYCLSKKDTENVAAGLMEFSGNRIKTGVYHADRHDQEKEGLHIAWRKGTIKVVCATIAFGLGIDKGNVRFVLHHSLSKSLDGYYQESGRAGRDGKEADCILYYRPQDGTTLSSMVAREKEGREKLHAMLKFAQDMQGCRKVQFANYFSHSSQLAMSSWTTDDSDALSRCGHCDNCIRPTEEINKKDVTFQAWQLVKITEAMSQNGAKVTLNSLAALARGNAGGEYDVVSGGKKGKGRVKDKQKLDLEAVACGKVELKKDEIEYLLVELLLQQYLAEEYHQTAYTTNVYLISGPLAPVLSRHTQDSLKRDNSLEFKIAFLNKKRKYRAKPDSTLEPTEVEIFKRKRSDMENSEDEHVEFVSVNDDKHWGSDGKFKDGSIHPASTSQQQGLVVNSSDEDDDEGWSFSIRSGSKPANKRLRGSRDGGSSKKRHQDTTIDQTILILSD